MASKRDCPECGSRDTCAIHTYGSEKPISYICSDCNTAFVIDD